MFKRRHRNTDTPLVRAFFSTAAGAVLATAAALLLAPAALADTSASANWAGYAVHRPGISFRTVSASWTQPNAACTPGNPAYSAYWVGLGGFSPNSPALEQIGTETDCNFSGHAVLSAWYELVPAPSVPLRLVVRPGDTITATVTVVGHRVTVSLTDVTRHRGFSKTMQAPTVDVSAAEWIVEAPSSCISINLCQTLPLANFGTARFTGAKAVGVKGRVGSIAPAPWSNTKIVLTPGGRRFVTYAEYAPTGGSAAPSTLQAGGSAFTVAYAPPSNAFTTRAARPFPGGRLFH